VRGRILLLLTPVPLAVSLALASPAPVRAANGMTETGTVTYEVIPSKGIISVSVRISVYNGKPNSGGYYYFWNNTEIAVEAEAGAISATSNGGRVSQSIINKDDNYRYVQLDYPNVYYGQTRVVTATYTIPAAPHAAGGYRAVAAYASLCAVGNGHDTGTVSVIIPDGFVLTIDSGDDLTKTADSAGKQVYSSGTQSNPYRFWSCFDAENAATFSHTRITASGQGFDLQSWPEDPAWSSTLGSDVTTDVRNLEALTGLTMPGGTVDIIETGDWQLGEYGGAYSSVTKTAYIPETVQPDVVAHELSHIWFNRDMFNDKWVAEGLAGYSEKAAGAGNFTACRDPGAYPGSGTPDLRMWLILDNNATAQDKAVVDYQYAASCYIFTSLGSAIGPDNLKEVLTAAADGEMAYIGATPGERNKDASLPLSAKQLLDLIDERGMVPAGIADLDQAQALLSRFGIFDTTTLGGRSEARSTYHELADAAGTWKLPLAIRALMTNWAFPAAQTAMATAREILDQRDAIARELPDLVLDGTSIQTAFEDAAGQTDLDNLLALITREADAAARVARATELRDGSHSMLQTIGLAGTDIETPLKQARTDLANVKPDAASAEAQRAIDELGKAGDQGLVRVGVLMAVLLGLAFLIVLIMFLQQRRKPATSGAPSTGQFGPAAWGRYRKMYPPAPGPYQWQDGGWSQPGLPEATPPESPGVVPPWPPAGPAGPWPAPRYEAPPGSATGAGESEEQS
jgi:hypothetical protein